MVRCIWELVWVMPCRLAHDALDNDNDASQPMGSTFLDDPTFQTYLHDPTRFPPTNHPVSNEVNTPWSAS